jgi:choline dehydrogenase-like flavoprotein
VESAVAGAGREIIPAEQEVILSAGATGSPRLLMLSGIGSVDHLRAAGIDVVHELPGVGSNLRDRLDLYAIGGGTGDHTYDGYLKPHRAAWAGAR